MQINVGKYVPRDTIIHRLDPRLKIVFNIVFAILFFVISHVMTLLILLALTLVFFYITTKRWTDIIKLLKLPVLLFLFMLVIYGFLINQENANQIIASETEKNLGFSLLGLNTEEIYVYVHWMKVWQIPNTSIEFQIGTLSLVRSVVIALRIYAMIISTTILTYSTKPFLLTKAIEDLIFPLRLLFIPTHIIAMIVSIAIRFIPTLLLEASRIMKAQSSRGVDFKNGKKKDKAKSMITLIIPLFVLSFSRAEDLSNAMEVRGYDPYAKRTKYRKIRFQWFDYLFLLALIALIAIVIITEQNVGQIMNKLPLFWKYTNQKV
ncbi:energy-coupling factor transporter transmembrane component T family protein [Mycoplasma sp. 1654_15]|uniref:energy-coupling factor transporter transmembrane component T family protein n=1 Tax=Mycoplasma sp. 1654_15 TaxID=2725994 RepID=UPI001448FDDC|nr:energy-coupling factor transporter transmembrane component T [Mycoplasma sp. 1654_15]QJB71476.1 energy-coupling factor transporter transmembrane protein EcfT [Mycoplasma sp. 1654_15]